MPDIYLHVGFPKTGTTFLQYRYFPHLKDVHILRHEHGRPPTGIVEILWRMIDGYPLFADLEKRRTQIERSLEGVVDDKLLITSEGLVGNPLMGFRENAQATACLRELFPAGKIILTVRRQDDFLESLYRQIIWGYFYPAIDVFLGYRNHEFTDWYRAPPGYPSINVWRLDYQVYAQNYAAVFGRQNILVLPYEMMRADPRTFYGRLAAFMGVEPYFPPSGGGDLNRSYSLLSSRIAFLLNRFVRTRWRERRPWHVIPHEPLTPYLRSRDRHDLADRLLDALNRRLSLQYVLKNVVDRLHYQRGNIITGEKRSSILDIHRESNRKLDEEYDIDLKRYGYY